MTKSAKKPPPKPADADDEVAPLVVGLTHLAFALALALMIARAMMSETIRDAFDVVPSSTAAPRGPGPASSLFLDALCCLSALLVLLRRAIDRQYILRLTWSHALFIALAFWATLSVAWATDKFTAIVSAAHVVAAAAMLWAMTQLVRSWLRLRIVAGVCLGLLLVYTAQGLFYKFVDVPENAKFWAENRETILRERGWEPDTFQAKQFEKKFVGGEMIGFNTSPNSFAAVLVMLIVVSAGVAMQRGISGVVIAALMLPALLVLWYTNTRTAAGTLLLSTLALAPLAASRTREFLIANRRTLYVGALATITLVTALIITHGIRHGTLFHDSLNFRWRYWLASASLIKQHPLLGVGWGNFGEHYLAVRLPAAAEEIRDPHNFIVRAFTELGIIGGLIVIAWLARSAWEVTRPVHPQSNTSTSTTTTLLTAIFAIAMGTALSMAISIDWAQNGAYVFLEVFRRIMSMGLLALGLILAVARRGQDQKFDIDNRPAPWLLYAMIVALGAMLVHAMMDFVLAEPGPLILFVTLMGAVLGIRMPSAAGQRRHRNLAIGIFAAAALAWVIAVGALVIPVADAESRAQQADEHVRAGQFKLAAGLFRSAFDTVPTNADYAYRAARAMMMANDPPDQIKATLAFAIDSNPTNVGYYLSRALLELHQPNPDFPAAQRDFESALKLDPQNVAVRLDCADALAKFNKPAEAIAQYQKALATNEKYDVTEPKRLSRQRIAQIEETIRTLVAATPASRSSAPATAR